MGDSKRDGIEWMKRPDGMKYYHPASGESGIIIRDDINASIKWQDQLAHFASSGCYSVIVLQTSILRHYCDIFMLNFGCLVRILTLCHEL